MDLNETDDQVKLPSLSQWVRGAGAVMGLAMMLLGVIYAVRIFKWIVTGLKNPEVMDGLIARWEGAITGNEPFLLQMGEEAIPLSRLLAIGVLGLGVWVLIKIALMFLTTGSKAISHSLGEKEAIKRILTQVFGAGNFARATSESESASKDSGRAS